jgi:hypothetical protein
MGNFPKFLELIQIVVKPREVIRKIINASSKKYFILLSFLLGMIGLFDLCSMADLGKNYDVGSILLFSVIFALPYGFAILSLFSVIVFGISKIFKGKAGYYQTRAAIVWAFMPRVLNLLFWGVNIAMLQSMAFQIESPIAMVGPVFYTYQVTTFLMALVVVWTWVSSLQTLSEVHGFSAWYSLVVVVLSTFVLMGFWILVSMIANILGA